MSKPKSRGHVRYEPHGEMPNERWLVMKEEKKISMSAIIEATFKKLPWLGEHFDLTRVGKVSFRLFTYDLLGQDCEYHYPEYGEGHYYCPAYLGKKIILFSKEGQPIGQVGVRIEPAQANVPCRRFVFWKGTKNVPAETVLFNETVSQALERLDQKHKAYFIIGLLGCDLIITSPSSGNTITDSIEAEIEKAEVEVTLNLPAIYKYRQES